MKIEQQTKETLEFIKTEIKSGMVLNQKNDGDLVWNDAHRKCLHIVELYLKGNGLFQMTKEK
jgi:hypothetical protein